MTLEQERLKDTLSYRIGRELYQKGVLKYEPADLSAILRRDTHTAIETALGVLDDFIEDGTESRELEKMLESKGKTPKSMSYEKIEPYARDRYDNVVVPALRRALINGSEPSSQEFEAEFLKVVKEFKQTYLIEVIYNLFRDLDKRIDEVYPKKSYPTPIKLLCLAVTK